jgi:hypothetical protein
MTSDLLSELRLQKEAGNSKARFPIHILEDAFRKAAAYDSLPALVKDAAKQLKGESE